MVNSVWKVCTYGKKHILQQIILRIIDGYPVSELHAVFEWNKARCLKNRELQRNRTQCKQMSNSSRFKYHRRKTKPLSGTNPRFSCPFFWGVEKRITFCWETVESFHPVFLFCNWSKEVWLHLSVYFYVKTVGQECTHWPIDASTEGSVGVLGRGGHVLSFSVSVFFTKMSRKSRRKRQAEGDKNDKSLSPSARQRNLKFGPINRGGGATKCEPMFACFLPPKNVERTFRCWFIHACDIKIDCAMWNKLQLFLPIRVFSHLRFEITSKIESRYMNVKLG